MASKNTSKATVGTPSMAHKAMMEESDLPLTLFAGPNAMRAAGTKFLRKETQEGEAEYDVRLQRSTLFNAYRKAVLQLKAEPFKKPITMDDKSDPLFKDMKDDVDNEGTNLTGFGILLLEELLNSGLVHILVDFPNLSDNKDLTVEKRALPYFTLITASSLIGWKFSDDAEKSLEQIRIASTDVVPEGEWGEALQKTVRVIENAIERTFIYDKDKEHWVEDLDRAARRSLGSIGLVTIYSNKKAELVGHPCLADLAEQNLRHWQSQSDQNHILHLARVPFLFGAGFEDKALDGAKISPSSVITNEDEKAKLGWVETTGNGINAGKEDLEAIENRMRILSMDMVVQRSGGVTATSDSINQAKSESTLQAISRNLENGLALAFKVAGKWKGKPDAEVSIEIFKEFGISQRTEQELTFLLNSRTSREIDQETFLKECKRRGVLSDDTDIEVIIEKTDAEDEEPNLGDNA